MDSALWYIVGILGLVLGLAISIGLHEWGHYYPAKKFGVAITQFMVGFGPTLWSVRRGDTEYGVKAIPLGGYVAMQGMFAPGTQRKPGSTGADLAPAEPGPEEPEVDPRRSFYRLSIPRRVIVMLGGPAMNLVIAFVLYAVLLMGFGLVQPSLTVGSVSECVLPATSTRQECRPGDPAAPGNQAGIVPGDTVVAVDGVALESWEELTEAIRSHPGQQLNVTVLREGITREIRVTPLLTERYRVDSRGQIAYDATGDPIVEEVGFVGIGATLESARQPLSAVPGVVWDNVVGVARVLLTLPERMVQVAQAAFGTEERDPNGPISVVGVGRIAGEIASLDTIEYNDRIASFLALLASLNVALCVFNLIPLLPLDGGHVALALADSARTRLAQIRGRPRPEPINPQRLMPLTLVVVVALIGMSVLLMYADIVNPISLLR